MTQHYLVVDPIEKLSVIKALASEVRLSILQLLNTAGPKNVNEVAAKLDLPQSTVSSNMQVLEEAGLVQTRSQKAKKGSQKICHAAFNEILIGFNKTTADVNAIEVAMPLGLYTQCEVSAPCGLCAPDGIIGLLDVPETFLDPDRMKAGLLWFTHGFVEYQFPNNARNSEKSIAAVEFSVEVSSEVPGTSSDWPSDIAVAVNGREIGVWTSPGDFGDKRGVYTPNWWKLEGSQYGALKTWQVNHKGSFVDGVRISDVTLNDLEINDHKSVRVRIGVHENAEHPGGLNIFGRGFGNFDQDIVLRTITS